MAHWSFRFPNSARLLHSRLFLVIAAPVALGLGIGLIYGVSLLVDRQPSVPADTASSTPSPGSASQDGSPQPTPQPATTVTVTVTARPEPGGPTASAEDLAIGQEMLDALDLILPRDYRPGGSSDNCWERRDVGEFEQIVLSGPGCGIVRSDTDEWLHWWGLGFTIDPDTDQLESGSLLVHTGHLLRVTAFEGSKPEVVDLITPQGAVVRLRTAPTDGSAHSPEPGTDLLPAEAVEFKGHHYFVAPPSVDTWEEASADCREQGAELAHISSTKENEFLHEYVIGEGFYSAYFGYSDARTEGKWAWSDGKSGTYTNWRNGEPSGGTIENYAQFYWGFPDGSWNDGDFGGYTVDDTTAYICEWSQ